MHDFDPALREWELAAQEAAQFDYENPLANEDEAAAENPFTELEEMELAAELLTLRDEAELDQFLGKVIKKAGRFVKGPLATVLKTVAKTALPIAGKVAGSFFGGPLGGALGSKLGSVLSSALELEQEGIRPADQEFEAARRFVRFAGTAAVRASHTTPKRHPWSSVRQAALYAARRHVPGLLRRRRPSKARPYPSKRPLARRPLGGFPRQGVGAWTPGDSFAFADVNTADADVFSTSGRWVRQGPRIVILNCYGNAPASTSPSIQLSSSLAGDEALAGNEGGESAGELFHQPYSTFI